MAKEVSSFSKSTVSTLPQEEAYPNENFGSFS